MLGSAFFWARKHREHHRYTDTELDPYGINKGILHAHILWTMVKEPSKKIQVDVSDLKKDKIVSFQHKYYVPCTLFMSWIFPTLVAGYGWNDWFGGFIYAGIIRTFFVNQGIFCLNSLAHTFGEQPYDDRRSPRNHWFTAIVTLGEGYHNFHHEFPSDYRNAIRWYQFDPTKWVIWLSSVFGMADNLKRFPQNEIGKGQIQMIRKKIDNESRAYNWGPAIEDLPIMEWDDFVKTSKSPDSPSLIAIEGVIHDVSNFIEEHPGGKNFIKSAIGKDATALFNGGVYNHANAARNLLATLRVAILRGGGEVDIWKKTPTTIDATTTKTEVAQTDVAPTTTD
jgi:stearoyl-CoA desaturase (Delta-9 desaturase)